MNRRGVLLPLLLLLALGLVAAQSMMGGPNGGPWGPGGAQNQGFGMMGQGQGGMMGGMMGGMGMMQVLPSNATPLDEATLRERLEATAATFGDDVRVADVMPFSNHTYAQLVTEDGVGVAEVLVDRYSGDVTPEPGPNMMWNRARGMGGAMMMGRGNGGARRFGGEGVDRYDEASARERAEAFLETYLPGASVHASQAFPGYVTLDYGRDGRIEGMLSVHGTTGLIWLHEWHGIYLGDGDDHD